MYFTYDQWTKACMLENLPCGSKHPYSVDRQTRTTHTKEPLYTCWLMQLSTQPSMLKQCNAYNLVGQELQWTFTSNISWENKCDLGDMIVFHILDVLGFSHIHLVSAKNKKNIHSATVLQLWGEWPQSWQNGNGNSGNHSLQLWWVCLRKCNTSNIEVDGGYNSRRLLSPCHQLI